MKTIYWYLLIVTASVLIGAVTAVSFGFWNGIALTAFLSSVWGLGWYYLFARVP